MILGAVANTFDPKPAYGGILGAIFLGVTGALIGGILSLLFFRSGIFSDVNLITLMIALGGSLTFLMIGKSIRKT